MINAKPLEKQAEALEERLIDFVIQIGAMWGERVQTPLLPHEATIHLGRTLSVERMDSVILRAVIPEGFSPPVIRVAKR